MKNNHLGRDASIIGRLDFHSEILFYANILVGNSSLCLDIGTVAWFLNLSHITWVISCDSYVMQLVWEEKVNFDHLVTIRPETVFICTNRMYQDLGKLLICAEILSLRSWLVEALSNSITLDKSALLPKSIR